MERHAGARRGGGMGLQAQQRDAVAAGEQVARDAQERVHVAGGADGDDEDVGPRAAQSSDLPTRSKRGCQ